MNCLFYLNKTGNSAIVKANYGSNPLKERFLLSFLKFLICTIQYKRLFQCSNVKPRFFIENHEYFTFLVWKLAFKEVFACLVL